MENDNAENPSPEMRFLPVSTYVITGHVIFDLRYISMYPSKCSYRLADEFRHPEDSTNLRYWHCVTYHSPLIGWMPCVGKVKTQAQGPVSRAQCIVSSDRCQASMISCLVSRV